MKLNLKPSMLESDLGHSGERIRLDNSMIGIDDPALSILPGKPVKRNGCTTKNHISGLGIRKYLSMLGLEKDGVIIRRDKENSRET